MTNINTYAVSSGWTWATLAQKNPKAKKAGVLAVALKGTPVSPANEVDAADGQAAITEQQKFFLFNNININLNFKKEMKRKDYERPTMKVVQLQHHGMLMTSVYETTGSGKTSLTEMEAEENL